MENDGTPRIVYPPGLPITARREEIIAALRSPRPRVLVISGETGCGKSTQLPKMCLEAGRAGLGRIGVTQPRRIAAVTIAARIAEELGETVGPTVGYKIRFQDRTSPGAPIKIMTDGILLAETHSDRQLRAYGTIIIDEAHERSLNIDFLLGIVRRLVDVRPELKVIITSATLDTEKFSRAFGNVPVIKVSGRSYPVGVEYRTGPAWKDPGPDDGPIPGGEMTSVGRCLPGSSGGTASPSARGPRGQRKSGPVISEADYIDSVVEAVEYLRREKDPGDILIFLPTEQDIMETCRILEGRRYPSTAILPLFSRLPGGEQRRVYTVPGPKIVVATNVAETSLTIPGVRFVIDTGLARIARYQPGTGINSLPISRISRASADQRKGRAGRVREGLCVRLYPEEDFAARDEFTPPEILRSDLAEVILRMYGLGLGDPMTFPFIDSPSGKAIRDGYDTLFELGAIRKAEKHGTGKAGRRGGPGNEGNTTGEGREWELTALGRIMCGMPLDPRLSRMLIQAAAEGALPEVAIIASALSLRDPRERPPGRSAQADEAQAVFRHPDSDFLSYLNIWHAFHGTGGEGRREPMTTAMKRRFCDEHFLSFLRMREWTYLYEEIISVIEEKGLAVRAAGILGVGPTAGRK